VSGFVGEHAAKSPPSGAAHPQALPRELRVRRRSEFQRIYRAGRRRQSRHFLWFVLREGAGAARFGITVSRRLGNAVARNRIRRRTREMLRRAWRRVPGGVMLVVNPRASVATEDFALLAEEVERELRLIAGGGAAGVRGDNSELRDNH
jgi:ribonuclease P protein component